MPKKEYRDWGLKDRNSSFGILGGLFDPPHIGHLIIGEWVLEEFRLDKIIFVPAYNPPHKNHYTPFQHRYEMTRIAIKKNENFLISDVERKIRGKSYTFRVLKVLKKIYRDGEFYLIIGADQWNEIDNWKYPELIFKEARVIVLPRPHYRIKKIKPFYNKILISKAPLVDISSTLIRARIKNGLSIEYLVVPEVANYIRRNKLYLT
ncbi:MAG: nicotinate-nucleotide adenylyltransferase [candidate division WOR-3 bacterium]|nr:nicotinate-nucleotide adenylyltransferase [candidate division WOR-3 bacterium]